MAAESPVKRTDNPKTFWGPSAAVPDKLRHHKEQRLRKSGSKRSHWTLPSLIPGLMSDMCLPVSLWNKTQLPLSQRGSKDKLAIKMWKGNRKMSNKWQQWLRIKGCFRKTVHLSLHMSPLVTSDSCNSDSPVIRSHQACHYSESLITRVILPGREEHAEKQEVRFQFFSAWGKGLCHQPVCVGR